MIDKRRIATAGVTLVFAIAAGHFMQSGGATAERMGSGVMLIAKQARSAISSNKMDTSSLISSLPVDILVPVLKSPDSEQSTTRIASVDQSYSPDIQSDVQTPKPFVLSCDIEVSALAMPSAMIDLNVKAPCHGNSVLEVVHAGLEFSGLTNALGEYQIELPAMAEKANISVEFNDDYSAKSEVDIPDFDEFTRSAVLWRNLSGLHVHAFEFGADYGENGHVWVGETRDPEKGVFADGGFLTRLGEKTEFGTNFAEVYTFPVKSSKRSGTVRLVVEAEVTAENCGKEIMGRTIELDAGNTTKQIELELSLPDCDSIGDFLVLKNLLQDLKIAHN